MKERIEVLLSAEQIDRRMAELADELYQEFGDEQVELVCALKGAVVTIVDLAKKMKMPVTMNFMSVSSYGNSRKAPAISISRWIWMRILQARMC